MINQVDLLLLALLGLILISLLLLFILLYLLFLRPRKRRGEKPAEEPERIEPAGKPEGEKPGGEEPEYPPEEYYIQNELIVAGPAGIVADLSEKVQGGTVALTELDRLDFADLGERMAACARLPEKLVIVKYRIEGEQADVLDAIELINDVLGGPSRLLIKEPNWITGQPWEIEGSPWEIEGSPWEIEGSPDGRDGGGSPALNISPALFMEQWAFQIIGLPEARLKEGYSGANVVVGIFDSSPYGLNAAQSNLYFERSANLLAGPSPMKLNLCHVASSGGAVSKCPDGDDLESLKKSAVRNHGYFVAGLINAIAPESQLHLYRVLDNCNRGDLFLLLKGIFMFLRDVVIKEKESRMGAVINMSLVVRIPPSEAAFGLTTDLLSLNYILEAADCLGVVAVSAAGNSSAGAIIPRPASLPAGMSGVLSVAASNIDCLRSCFSNCGHVAVPGGDGRSADGSPEGGCKPRLKDCPDGMECKAAIIGPAIKLPFVNENDTHFIFWTGTSFAAPLTSGLASLVIQAGGGAYSPARVRKIIMCGAMTQDDYALGAGVVHIPRTLELCR